MPDWSEAIRERLRGLNLDGAREAEIIEELSQHLGDRYAEMVAGGAAEDQAFRSMMDELEESDLLEGLRNARQPAAREPLGLGSSGGTGGRRRPAQANRRTSAPASPLRRRARSRARRRAPPMSPPKRKRTASG